MTKAGKVAKIYIRRAGNRCVPDWRFESLDPLSLFSRFDRWKYFFRFSHVIHSYVKRSSRNSRAFHRRVLASRAAREASSRHRGEAAMVSQEPPPRPKFRRADTGGKTHENERGSAKSLCVNSTKVPLLSRDARTGAATKATGPSSSTRDSSDSSVNAMDVGKENNAPPDGRALKVRGESSVVAPRILVSVVARVRRADAAPARRASLPSRRLPRASVALPRASGRRRAPAAA